MVKTQFSIVFLIFNIPNSFCRNQSVTEESFIELGLWQKILYEYNEAAGASTSCWNMIVGAPLSSYEVRPFIGDYACEGEITSSAWSGDTEACVSTTGRSKIQWVRSTQYGIRTTYGKPDYCPKQRGLKLYQTKKGRSVCVCNCFHRNWNIYVGRMQSRESKNYVITGIRFTVRNNVLYLEIAESQLDANRKVFGFSWRPLPSNLSAIRRIDPASANIFTDDLKLNKGYALTEVQFKYMESSNGVKGFGISVSGRPFSNNGNLNLTPGNTLTIQPKSSTKRYVGPASLNQVKGSISERSPENNEYIKLEQSERTADYGQSTVPRFHNPFDHQILLSGFGIFYEISEAYPFEPSISLRFHEAQDK